MIICNLAVLLAKKKLKVSDAVRATGISQSTLLRLYHEQTTRIDFDTIEKLCEFLSVEVGALLEYVPNAKTDDLENSELVSKE
ncbi:MAG: helix-turn-helix transcriptional regulator [Gammaproteobacteria bacterium]|nr:helix-turn-helix transcriptional regulator [Gammaproteobacteria bacterium]